MYLSRAVLNPRVKEVRRDISNPYEMHCSLARVFSEQSERFLWRLETQTHRPVLLLQSAKPPNWDLLGISHYCSHIDASHYLTYLDALAIDQRFRFLLKANTTVTQGNKRKGLKDMESQLAWLQQRAEKNGFALIGAMVTSSEQERFKRSEKSDQKEMQIYLQATTFEGHLKVTDLDLFKHAQKQGLGPAKSLGCGLLTLARV